MKAVRIHSYGHSDQIRIEDTPNLTPKADEILVQIKDAGVNPVDWKVREGFLKEVRPAQFPLTLGADFAGVVIDVGARVSKYRRGDRVYGFSSGSYAEQALVTEDKIAKLPDRIDFVTAASIPTAGITAYQLIMQTVDLRKGQSILIHGAGGGVGSFAVQLALWKGAQVIATAADVDFDYLRSLGVVEVINYKTEKFEDRVRNVDIVIDLVGSEIFKRSVAVLKPGGIIATTVGPVDHALVAARNVRAVQFYAQHNSEDLVEMAKLVQQGVLTPRIHEVLPLEEARRAQDDLQNGHSQGKIILEVQS